MYPSESQSPLMICAMDQQRQWYNALPRSNHLVPAGLGSRDEPPRRFLRFKVIEIDEKK